MIDTLRLATCSVLEEVQSAGLARNRQSWLSLQPRLSILPSVHAAAQEAPWLQKLFADLQMSPQPIVMMEDNQGAIALVKNPVSHSKTKHIDIRFHFVREALKNGVIKVKYCPTEKMLADLFTKPIPRSSFESIRRSPGVANLGEL